MRHPLQSLTALTLLLVAAQPAAAHGFHLELQVEGARVHGEAYFGDGEPPGEATWTAYRVGQSAPLASGKLDPQGHFDWSAPSSGTYRCEVKEVGLHVASAEVQVEVPPGAAPPRTPGATATPALPGEARRKRRGRGGGRSRVKRLLTGLGAIVLLGVGMYRFQRRRRESDELEGEEPPGDSAPAQPPATSSGDL